MPSTERLLPDVPDLTPEELSWLEAAARVLQRDELLPPEARGDELDDDPEIAQDRRLGDVASALFDSCAPPPVPLATPADRDGLSAKLARACLRRGMLGTGGLSLAIRHESAAKLQSIGAIEPADISPIAEAFLADPDGEPLANYLETWKSLGSLVSGVLARKDISARKRLALGLAALVCPLAPSGAHVPMLDALLGMEEVAGEMSLRLLERIAGRQELFVVYPARGQALDPRASTVLAARESGEHRQQVVTALDHFLADALTPTHRAEAAKTLEDLESCLAWLQTAPGRSFASESLVFLLPLMLESQTRPPAPPLRLVGPSGPVDPEVDDLFERFSRRIHEAGAPDMVVFCLVPALPAAVGALSEELLDEILRLGSRPQPAKSLARGKQKTAGPRRLANHRMAELSSAVEDWIEEARLRVAPPIVAHLTELKNLAGERLAAVETEIRSAREAAQEGRDFELSPLTTLLFSPQSSWVRSRAGRPAALGLEVTAARRLSRNGRSVQEVARLASATWTEEAICQAGSDLPWAAWLVTTSGEEFDERVCALAGKLKALGPLAADSPLPTLQFECQLRGYGDPVRLVELTVDQTLEDLHVEIHRAFGWDFDSEFEFEAASISEEFDPSEEPDWTQFPLLLLDLGPDSEAISYVMEPGFDAVELRVRLAGTGLAVSGERYPRLLESRGESPAGDELFSDFSET